MIKTPVRCYYRGAIDSWRIRASDNKCVCTVSSREDAYQIVAALNAQQPAAERIEELEYDKDTLTAYRSQNMKQHARIEELEKALRELNDGFKNEYGKFETSDGINKAILYWNEIAIAALEEKK